MFITHKDRLLAAQQQREEEGNEQLEGQAHAERPQSPFDIAYVYEDGAKAGPAEQMQGPAGDVLLPEGGPQQLAEPGEAPRSPHPLKARKMRVGQSPADSASIDSRPGSLNTPSAPPPGELPSSSTQADADKALVADGQPGPSTAVVGTVQPGVTNPVAGSSRSLSAKSTGMQPQPWQPRDKGAWFGMFLQDANDATKPGQPSLVDSPYSPISSPSGVTYSISDRTFGGLAPANAASITPQSSMAPLGASIPEGSTLTPGQRPSGRGRSRRGGAANSRLAITAAAPPALDLVQASPTGKMERLFDDQGQEVNPSSPAFQRWLVQQERSPDKEAAAQQVSCFTRYVAMV